MQTLIRKALSCIATTSLGLLIAGAMTSCSPVKGYVGPELPETQIAAVFLDYDSTSATINQSGIEGTAFGAAGIHILPGKHTYDLQISIKEKPDNCYSYGKVNSYSLEECRKKDKGRCSCHDFIDVYERCHFQVRDGICNGKFNSRAGKQYDIRLTKYGNKAETMVYQRGAGVVGEGKCNMGEWRTESDESMVGSGRWEAESHGIYSCY